MASNKSNRTPSQNNKSVPQAPLEAYPTQPWAEFSGYVHKKDETLIPNELLTYPTVNVIMPDGDKIVPRGGEVRFPQNNAIQNSGMIGHFKKFQNISGIEMEMRVWNDNTMTLGSITGAFVANETITGGASGATAKVNSFTSPALTFANLVGNFDGGEMVTGSISGAHGIITIYKGDVIEVLYNGTFQQITPNLNPLEIGLSAIGSQRIYYFDQFIDTDLDPALSLNTNRAVWVMGLPKIRSWTGGIASVVSVVPNVSISTTTGISWSSLGFTDPLAPGLINFNTLVGTFAVGDTVTGLSSGATGKVSTVNSGSLFVRSVTGTFLTGEAINGEPSGASAIVSNYSAPYTIATNTIVINGVVYTPTGGWETDTLLISDTTGISVGNTAFSGIEEYTTPGIPAVRFDYVSAFKNYLCYGNWNLQKFYVANNFNRDATQNITNVQAIQNDLVLDNSAYTGTGSHVYRITIDSVFPLDNTQSYIPSGNSSGLNDALWQGTGGQTLPTGYTGAPNFQGPNIYTINMIADALVETAGTMPVASDSQTIVGNTSQATGIVRGFAINAGNCALAIEMTSDNMFSPGETITCSNGNTETVVQAQFQNWIQYLKNGAIVPINIGLGILPLNPLSSAGSITLTDGLIITFANFYGHSVGDSFQLSINQGGYDTFQWQIDGAVPLATKVPITGISQILNDGVSITFVSETGHTLGDFWEITVFQSILGAWHNFYYSLPRRPGEGYIGQLPANFWTMKPQEDLMYVNDAAGHWGTIGTTLSADLQTETIDYTPLKQRGRNKVIFPYMIGYRDNDICYVTEDKNLDMIGREPLLQLPQITHLSDPVKLDFLAATFENGSIEWNALRLYMTSPTELLMFCYDEAMGYWQAPQLFPENGILSEVGIDLISHSNIRNVTNTLFTGTNDNGQPFPIKIRTGYNFYGNRWMEDVASMLFLEGKMQGNPQMTASAYLDLNGCKGIVQGLVDPVYCIVSDRASLGAGSLGSHSLGSDEDSPIPYFRWIGVGQKSFGFYMAAFDLECETLDPIFEILSMALNTVASENNNGPLKKGQVKLI